MKSMMRRTTFREIKNSFGRYVAILAIVALGVGFFAGLRVTKPAMLAGTQAYLEKGNFFDFQVLSTLGFTKDDVEEFSKIDDIKEVKGAFSVDFLCENEEGQNSVFKAHSITENINTLIVQDGKLPEHAKECVIDSLAVIEGEEMIGKTIRISKDNELGTLDQFAYDEYKIVGVVDSPCYLNFERGNTAIGNGKIDSFVYMPEDSFSMDYYTELFLTAGEHGAIYSDEYKDFISDLEPILEKKSDELLQEKYDAIPEDLKVYVDSPKSYVLNRDTNVGYACFESDSKIVEGISNVFPIFFFLVAGLVCMTTMNRMVEEQRTQIGVLKALGYSNAAIMGKYVVYSGTAAIMGGAIGLAIGCTIFPKTIWQGYSIMYRMGEIPFVFDWQLAAISMAVALLCSVGATYYSCRHELRSVPAKLIRPKAPKSGKRILIERITPIWKRLKFLQKVSIRNIARYKKRFFMMIIGISGCTALLVTGFGVRDSIANVIGMQYDEIQKYDLVVTLKEELPLTTNDIYQENAEFFDQVDDVVAERLLVAEKAVDLLTKNEVEATSLVVVEKPKEMETFLDLHTEKGKGIAYPGMGETVITNKMAKDNHIKIGDTITFQDKDEKKITAKVTAICENYVGSAIYISSETYVEAMGTEPEYKTIFANISEKEDLHESAAKLMEISNVAAVTVNQDFRERFANMMKSLDSIVFLIIVSAGSLAFIVIYNLTNINITERVREIATIKVLGFYPMETASYVFRENMVLTGIGALTGLILGVYLHRFVMFNINVEAISFDVRITPASFMFSFIITFLFTVIVNFVLYFKLERINMVESLKSVE